jgi:hypothetical protein
MTCYNETERAQAALKYPKGSNSSDTALGAIWASSGIFADLCYERKKDIGQFVGTAFGARDLMSVVDALDEDGMLRYWGKKHTWVLFTCCLDFMLMKLGSRYLIWHCTWSYGCRHVSG